MTRKTSHIGNRTAITKSIMRNPKISVVAINAVMRNRIRYASSLLLCVCFWVNNIVVATFSCECDCALPCVLPCILLCE